MSNVFDEFVWRGLVYDHSLGLPEHLAREKVTSYIGFDPSSDSLQVGNLMTLMCLARMQHYGHSPIVVAGGGTGLIGDPSGKKGERKLQSREKIAENTENIKRQLAQFLDFSTEPNPARLVNNADWLTKIPMIDFLRDVGPHFTVSYMLRKDAVNTRIGREESLSYAEFSYMLLQAYDFLHLFDEFGCTVQAGGSDQWGNITAGTDLIRKTRAKPAYGLVFPLVTDAKGVKLGKTERGAIYLDKHKTLPEDFHKFWLNTADADVTRYLKYFTWRTQEEITALERETAEHPEKRAAQQVLADDLMRMVHGEEELSRVRQIERALYGGAIQGKTRTSSFSVDAFIGSVPISELPRTELTGNGKPLVDLLAETGFIKSKNEARRLILSGGIYVNGGRAQDLEQTLTLDDVTPEGVIVLRKGKKEHHLVKVIDSPPTDHVFHAEEL